MNQDNNLLSFLKKQSLFNHSSSRQRRSSRSKDRNSLKRSQARGSSPLASQHGSQTYDTHNPLYASAAYRPNNNNAPVYSLHNQTGRKETLTDSRYGAFEALEQKDLYPRNPELQPRMELEPNRPNYQLRNSSYETGRGYAAGTTHSRGFDLPPEPQMPAANDNITNIWSGLVAYSTSFQSARIESQQCLEGLSQKVHRQVASLTHKIDAFNGHMHKTINAEFKVLKERIMQVINQAFRDSETYIREYMREQEQLLCREVLAMKESLGKQLSNIERMSEEIKTPQWRKVAGEIIASELQNKVDDLVRESAKMGVGRWQLGDIGGYRIREIEKGLQDILRLKACT